MSDAPRKPAASVRRYNLLDDRERSRSRMPAFEPTIDMVNDRFCRSVRAALLQHLRRAVEVSCAAIESVKHRALLDRLQVPSYLTLITMRPLHGTIIVVIDAALVASIVESRFGGDGRFPLSSTNREFSPFEHKSMRRVIETTLAQLAVAWEPVGRFEPEIVRQEINPQYANFAATDDPVIVSAFDVKIDRGHGQLIIGIPYAALEPLQDRLNLEAAEDLADRDQRWFETLHAGIGQALITLTAELSRIEISVADLVALRPGNVFEMDRHVSATIQANGVPLFRGRWGRHGRKIAVRVDERLVPVATTPSRTAKNGASHE
ncbi:MAG TPA: FliM/FliN family flagellar motor switch protein [Stellaceae bacterium]|nr:FliM/FliN family flagellar motor switch protein [Stellaceae bacterium]